MIDILKRIFIGVAISMSIFFIKSHCFALTLDGTIVTETQVFNSNVIYSRTSSSSNNPDGIQKIFDFNYSNTANHDYIVFPAIGVLYNRNYYTGSDINNDITFSSFDIFNAFVSIKLIPTSGQWVSCEFQNNFIVCPMLPNTTYKGLEFIISNYPLPSSSELGFSLTLNKYAWIYDKDIVSKETLNETKKITDTNDQSGNGNSYDNSGVTSNNNKEESLTDGADDLFDNFDVDLSSNSNAFQFIFQLLTRFVQANAKIFGVILSILSFGFIKLVLGR